MKAMIAGAALLGALLTAGASAHAQGSCQVQGWASCTLGGDATHSISVTITSVAAMQLANGTVTLPTPDHLAYSAGFTGTGSVAYSIKANNPWTITIAGATAFWGATPGTARQNKPVSDLQFATAPAGPFADLSTTQATLATGAASAGSFLTLYLRSKLSYALDNVGAYTMQVNLVITAP